MPTILRYTDKGYEKKLAALDRVAAPNHEVSKSVAAIIDQVRSDGDKALIALTEKFDKMKLTAKSLRVARQPAAPSPKVRRAMKHSLANIRAFCKASLPKTWHMKNKEGAQVGEVYRPFDRVGINVPGGVAPLVSSALMTVGLAAAAGVKEIVVCTPPPVNDNLLYAIHLAGAQEVYQVGGPHAMAALALGTKTISRVQKLFGPGNAYVVEAKRQLMGAVSIDQLPGPSEIAVLADASCCPEFAAADLLAQAEHGHGSQILFVTTSAKVLDSVLKAVAEQLPQLTRQEFLQETFEEGGTFVLAKSKTEAVDIVERFAPEHLSLATQDARQLAGTIRNAGAIFVGNYSPVAAGDFVAGPSHTLPTGGAAKSFAGLRVTDFLNRTSVVEYNAKTIAPVVPLIEAFSEIEDLDAHGRSASIRLG